MVKLPDGKHNPCYLNIRMTWSETLKRGFQSCIRPWHNSIQAGGPNGQCCCQGPFDHWHTKSLMGGNGCSGDFEHEDDQHLFSFPFPLLFSWVHNTYWPTLHNSCPLFFYWVHHTSALFQKENDTSCSRQCFFFFFLGGEADIHIFSTWEIWLQYRF
jgi:hypothetical protein